MFGNDLNTTDQILATQGLIVYLLVDQFSFGKCVVDSATWPLLNCQIAEPMLKRRSVDKCEIWEARKEKKVKLVTSNGLSKTVVRSKRKKESWLLVGPEEQEPHLLERKEKRLLSVVILDIHL